MPKKQKPEVVIAEHVLAILNDPHTPTMIAEGLHATLLELSDSLVWTQRPGILRAVLAEALRKPPEPPTSLTLVRIRKSMDAAQAPRPEGEDEGGDAAGAIKR